MSPSFSPSELTFYTFTLCQMTISQNYHNPLFSWPLIGQFRGTKTLNCEKWVCEGEWEGEWALVVGVVTGK